MALNIEKPRQVRQALCGKKGWNMAVEIIVAIVVYFVASILMSIIMTPPIAALLTGNSDYQNALLAGDVEAELEAYYAVLGSDMGIIIMLFVEFVLIDVVLIFCMLVQKRNMGSLGFTAKGALPEYLFGLLAGFAAFSLVVLINVVSQAMTISLPQTNASAGIIVLFFLAYLVQGMAEEVLCRGYLMVSIARRYPMWAAILANSVVFALLHGANDGVSVLALVNLMLFGIFASLYFIRRGSIWGIAAFHSIWNFTQGNFFGISVSGTGTTASVFSCTMTEGMEWTNGGSFGAEGGTIVTAVLILGILLLYFCGDKLPASAKEDIPRVKLVMFDLDGTLLPMDQEKFVKHYFTLLSNRVEPLGYEPKEFISNIWKGIAAMVKNDGSKTNEEAFWSCFAEIYGDRVYEDKEVFNEFYRTEFNKVKRSCGNNPQAAQLIQNMREAEIPIGLATNPIFPRVATENRIRWAGLNPSDFRFITTYENCSTCKPNPQYFSDLADEYGVKAEECLMVGNDVSEDMVAKTVGMKVFLLTDCLINKEGEDIEQYPHGDFKKLTGYLQRVIA